MKEIVPVESQHRRLEKEKFYTQESIIILAPAKIIYEFWLNPENFKAFSAQIKSIQKVSDSQSHWIWNAMKDNKTVEWDSQIVETVPDRVVAWRSTGNSDIQLAGRLELKELPYNRGTEVKVALGTDLSATVQFLETLLGESPHRNLKMFLVKLRQLLETGEISTVEGQSAGDNRKTETTTALH
jgi:uncharacterized membrane protein